MRKKSLGAVKIITTALVLSTVFSGCGSSNKAEYATADRDAYTEEAAAADPGEGLYEAAYGDEYAESEATDTSGASNGAEEITEEKADKNSKRKLITNMSMTAETKEFDKTVNFLQHRTEELGGYVERFSTSKSSYSDERTAYMTLRVPEEKLSGFVNEVADESNITSQDMSVTDVTLTYADLESHKNALRAEEEQLLNLMEKAETIEDIMSVQDKLTDVRYQIESMESQLRTYDNQITYSTLSMTVEEVIDYTPEPVKNPTFWERARDGFLDNCHNVATFFKELILFIIGHIITLLILGAIIAAIVILIRKSEKKRKERLAKMPKPEMPVTPAAGFNYGQQAGQINNQTNTSQIPVPDKNINNTDKSNDKITDDKQ